MNPVLGKVRHQDDEQYLESDGTAANGVTEPVRASPIEQDQRRLQREDRQHLDQQRVDEEVGQVDHPLPPEHRLPRAQGEQPLERNEDRRIKKEVQDEEIKRQPGGATFCRRRNSSGAAKERRGKRETEPRQGQRLVGTQDGADTAEEKGGHESQVNDCAQVR